MFYIHYKKAAARSKICPHTKNLSILQVPRKANLSVSLTWRGKGNVSLDPID